MNGRLSRIVPGTGYFTTTRSAVWELAWIFVILDCGPEAGLGIVFQLPVSPGGPAVVPGGRNSTGPWCPSLVAGMVSAGQPGARAWSRAVPTVILLAQGHGDGGRSSRRRPPRTMHLAAQKIRSRSGCWFPTAGGPGQGAAGRGCEATPAQIGQHAILRFRVKAHKTRSAVADSGWCHFG